MSNPSFQRMRRILLLLPLVARATRAGRGVPIDRAVAASGARGEAQLREDIAAVQGLWTEPAGAEEAIYLYVEDGEVFVTYAQPFGAPPALSLAEGAMLLAALAPFEARAAKTVRDAMRKLRRAVPELLRADADRLSRGLDLGEPPPEPWAAPLQQAIDERREVALEYRAVADAELSRKVVEPRLLFRRGEAWYLAAWNVEKREEHLYRLDRIAAVAPGTRTFAAHQGPPTSRYQEQGVYFSTGAEVEVTLRYTGLSAALARQRHGARAVAAPDGSVTVRSKLSPGPFLTGQVLAHGGEAAVVAPRAQAEQVAEEARRLLELYRDG